MISKALFIEKLSNEVRILKHLASKATSPELLAFQFSPTQRTTAQWFAYISLVGSACAKDIINDDSSGFASFTDHYEAFDIANFNTIIDNDLAEISALIESASDEKLAEQKILFGNVHDTRVGHLLMIYSLYAAYKTQIFLQLKAAGLTHLNT